MAFFFWDVVCSTTTDRGGGLYLVDSFKAKEN